MLGGQSGGAVAWIMNAARSITVFRLQEGVGEAEHMSGPCYGRQDDLGEG